MSSFAKLKELAQQRAQAEQDDLNRDRERSLKEATAKRLAREEQEQAQRERERKILVQKMSRQKQEAALERSKRDAAMKVNSEGLEDDTLPKASAAQIEALLSTKKKQQARAGSTHKVDMSGEGSALPRERKPRLGLDDFVGNRLERTSQSRSVKGSAAAVRKKAVPLTREEKQALKRAKEFGSLPRSSVPSHVTASPALVQSDLRHRSTANGLVALGTNKRDQRSIDEIERDLWKSKKAKTASISDDRSRVELEREAALLRRKKAMEQKRNSDRQASGSMSRVIAEDDDSSGDETDSGRRADSPSKHDSDTSSRPRTKDSAPFVRARSTAGVNPADFLPGAPLNANVMERLAQRTKQQTHSSSSDTSKPKKGTTRDSKATEVTSAATPNRRETARDRFIREQAAKKTGSSKRTYALSDSQSDSLESDEYDSDDDEGDHNATLDVRDEIWKMFGKDRKAYAQQRVDSDDDMEADAASVLQEELRSAKQARLEDQREEELERQREQAKLLRKKSHVHGQV